MTDEEIKAIVRKYILDGIEEDNSDCLEFEPGLNQDGKARAYELYRSATVTVRWGDND